jgi:hypothetical protein
MLDQEPRLEPIGNDARFVKARAAIAVNATPCANPSNPEYRQFDFW